MKIHILTFNKPGRPSPVIKTDLDLLKKAAEKQGHEIEIIHAPDCQLKFHKTTEVLIKNKKPEINVLINRPNFLREHIEFRVSLIKQFSLSNIPMLNKYKGVIRAKNKMRTMQILAKKNIPIPKTYFVRSAEHLEEIAKDIGKFPVIIKTIAGSHGNGVSLVESERGLKSIVELLVDGGNPAPLMIQKYVKESKGKDIRGFILGKRILGAMERIATKKGEFRSNFHLGGRVGVAELSRKEKDIAFAATEACGLDIAGVDILRTNKGPVVLEVNANPGLEGITEATGRDIAGEIIKYAVQKAKRYIRKKENNK